MILEVFSCSGGMAEGLRRAGLVVDVAIDADTDACDSYAANLGHRPLQLDARDLLRMVQAGWRPGSIEMLIADPPCTPWSRAGKRQGRADDRDMLDVTVALIRVLKPWMFLIANVPGLDDGPNWPIVQETIGSLVRDGYCVADFARLDAADYGVPQHRVRPFWYGHRDGPCIQWPARTHGAPAACGATLPGVTSQLKPWVTCRQALRHLSAEDLGSPVRLRWRGCKGNQLASVPDAPARVVGTSNLSDGNVLAPPETAFRDKREHRHPGRKARASEADAPASVVTCRENGDGNILMYGPNHRPSRADEFATRSMPTAIKLSEKAGAILQGFPSGWVFAGETKRARWSQIGQAMPPPLAEAVGRRIVEQMCKARTRVA